MSETVFTRRAALLGGLALLPGCSALSALDSAATPLDTFDLLPVPGAGRGPRTGRTLLVLAPEAAAVVSNDRILMRPNAQSVVYLPGVRWSDQVPQLVQSLLIRSVSATGRIGFVGTTDAGPVPDVVLLTRIDAFGVDIGVDGAGAQVFMARIALDLTLLRDVDQRIIASRRFSGTAQAGNDAAATVAAAMQQILNTLLPQAADWAVAGTA